MHYTDGVNNQFTDGKLSITDVISELENYEMVQKAEITDRTQFQITDEDHAH